MWCPIVLVHTSNFPQTNWSLGSLWRCLIALPKSFKDYYTLCIPLPNKYPKWNQHERAANTGNRFFIFVPISNKIKPKPITKSYTIPCAMLTYTHKTKPLNFMSKVHKLFTYTSVIVFIPKIPKEDINSNPLITLNILMQWLITHFAQKWMWNRGVRNDGGGW